MTDTYLSFFQNYPLEIVWPLFLLGLARILPVIALVPALGGKTLPNSLKMGFGISLVTVFLPFMVVHTQGAIPTTLTLIFLTIKEIVIGSLLGFIAAIPFYYAQSAGTIIDHQRGSQSLQVTDPSTQTQASPTGLLYNNMMIVTFFFIGGPFFLFQALFVSYEVIPPDRFLNPAFFSADMPIWNVIIKTANTILVTAAQLAAPSIIAILMSDLFLGIANRMAPQVQISFLLWSLKAFIGIFVLWAAWWLVLRQIDSQCLSWFKMIPKLAPSFGANIIVA